MISNLPRNLISTSTCVRTRFADATDSEQRDLYRTFACPATSIGLSSPDCENLGLKSPALAGQLTNCLIRSSEDWVDAVSRESAHSRCQVRTRAFSTALQISPIGCGIEGLLSCFVCCNISTPSQPPSTALPSQQQRVQGTTLANPLRPQSGTLSLGAREQGVRITFEFLMRDIDGLPVVKDYFRGTERVRQFRFLLEREDSSDTKGLQLSAQVVTTGISAFTSKRPARLMQGRVEVGAVLQAVGPHHVTLFGPQTDPADGLAELPWNVSIFGLCPLGGEAVNNNDLECTCKRGFEPEDTDGDGLSDLCVVCDEGFIKPTLQGRCRACADVQSEAFGGPVSNVGDPNRRLTREELLRFDGLAVLRRTPDNHDDLGDCGCSPGHFMKFDNNTARGLRAQCPSALQPEKWLSAAFVAKLDGYRSRLECTELACSRPSSSSLRLSPATSPPSPSGTAAPAGCDFDTHAVWVCVERECRADFIATETIRVEEDATQRGTCRSCRAGQSVCTEPFTVIHPISASFRGRFREMKVQPGFWRSNELSDNFKKCRPGHCLGSNTSETRLTENLCANGHWGPLCASCLDGFFKTSDDLCQSCEQTNVNKLIFFAPAFIFLGLVLLFCLCALLRCSPRAMRKAVGLVGYISITKHEPQIKIVLGLLQVQVGLATLSLVLPEQFKRLMRMLSILQLDIPLSCVIRYNHFLVLFFYTVSPLGLWMALLSYASWYSWRAKKLLDSIERGTSMSTRFKYDARAKAFNAWANSIRSLAYLLLFFLYPGATAIQFRTFVCTELDDGTSFLRADPSVSCETTEYTFIQFVSALGLFVYVILVPLLYIFTVFRYRPQLKLVDRLERYLVSCRLLGEPLDDKDISQREIEMEATNNLMSLDSTRLKGTALKRTAAHRRLIKFFPRFGIELDHERKIPTVKRIWPTYRLRHELSAAEEEAAFANYQCHRLKELRARKDQHGRLSFEDEALFQALRDRIDILSGSLALNQLSMTMGQELIRRNINLRVPCKLEWERMSWHQRARWVDDAQRSLPEEGDVLIAINGIPIQLGVQIDLSTVNREAAMRDLKYFSHDRTYHELEKIRLGQKVNGQKVSIKRRSARALEAHSEQNYGTLKVYIKRVRIDGEHGDIRIGAATCVEVRAGQKQVKQTGFAKVQRKRSTQAQVSWLTRWSFGNLVGGENEVKWDKDGSVAFKGDALRMMQSGLTMTWQRKHQVGETHQQKLGQVSITMNGPGKDADFRQMAKDVLGERARCLPRHKQFQKNLDEHTTLELNIVWTPLGFTPRKLPHSMRVINRRQTSVRERADCLFRDLRNLLSEYNVTLHDLFQSWDYDGDSELELYEFNRNLEDMGYLQTKQEKEELFSELDVEQRGALGIDDLRARLELKELDSTEVNGRWLKSLQLELIKQQEKVLRITKLWNGTDDALLRAIRSLPIKLKPPYTLEKELARLLSAFCTEEYTNKGALDDSRCQGLFFKPETKIDIPRLLEVLKCDAANRCFPEFILAEAESNLSCTTRRDSCQGASTRRGSFLAMRRASVAIDRVDSTTQLPATRWMNQHRRFPFQCFEWGEGRLRERRNPLIDTSSNQTLDMAQELLDSFEQLLRQQGEEGAREEMAAISTPLNRPQERRRRGSMQQGATTERQRCRSSFTCMLPQATRRVSATIPMVENAAPSSQHGRRASLSPMLRGVARICQSSVADRSRSCSCSTNGTSMVAKQSAGVGMPPPSPPLSPPSLGAIALQAPAPAPAADIATQSADSMVEDETIKYAKIRRASLAAAISDLSSAEAEVAECVGAKQRAGLLASVVRAAAEALKATTPRLSAREGRQMDVRQLLVERSTHSTKVIGHLVETGRVEVIHANGERVGVSALDSQVPWEACVVIKSRDGKQDEVCPPPPIKAANDAIEDSWWAGPALSQSDAKGRLEVKIKLERERDATVTSRCICASMPLKHAGPQPLCT